jgi:hypothetical protein
VAASGDQAADPSDGKRTNSKGWVAGAFSLIVPSPLAQEVVCIDDCGRCPLFKKGCAGGCPRWDDLVCSFCPCLGSKYSNRAGITTVDPDTLESRPEDPYLAKVRALRARMRDGDLITLDMVESTRGTKHASR